MTTYSVADAKGSLPRLLDRALEGEEVIISRHGKPIAELRPITSGERKTSPASYAWLKTRRQARKGVGMTSVDLLNQMYEAPDA